MARLLRGEEKRRRGESGWKERRQRRRPPAAFVVQVDAVIGLFAVANQQDLARPRHRQSGGATGATDERHRASRGDEAKRADEIAAANEPGRRHRAKRPTRSSHAEPNASAAPATDSRAPIRICSCSGPRGSTTVEKYR